MKKNIKTIWNRPGLKTLLLTLTFCISLMGGTSAFADEIFNSDFSSGTFDSLGWSVKGHWSIVDYGDNEKKIRLAANPGPVAKFAATSDALGSLTKKFPIITNPSSLTLTFDGGYGWGNKAHGQGLAVMLLDDAGNGYIFDSHRANAIWGAQWDKVTKNVHNNPLQWAPAAIDSTQPPVTQGGGLRTFTITRDGEGNWKFNGDGWVGGPLAFTDKTYTSFTQVVLVGGFNSDELLFNKIKLEVTK